MERAASLDDFLARPVARLIAGRTWIYFCAHPELFGIVLFGRPDRAEIEALAAALVVEFRDGIVPHRSLVDARRLAGTDLGAFEVLHDYVRRHHRVLAERVTRLALVRPDGMEGAVVAGFYGVLDPPYPVSVFDNAAAALDWLGEPREALLAEIAEWVGDVGGVDPVVGALRARLVGERELTVDAACRGLGLSERTLQRRLQLAGTSFQKELLAARLAEAQRRMLAGADPLTTIALDAGFSSLQHFSRLFRGATGETPSAWRARHRR